MQEKLPEGLRCEYLRVAYYYYKAKLTQEEIAKKMNMSRQRVNRILGKCENLGIVRIEIPGYEKLYFDLETKLEERYGLKAVRIVGSDFFKGLYADLGSAAGKYLSEILKNGDIIGFSRGRATAALVDSLPECDKRNLTVTQLVGGWTGRDTNIDVDDIVSRLAQKLGAKAVKLYVPVVVNSPEIRKSIMEEPFFQKAYLAIKACTIAVVGIGTLENRKHLISTVPGLKETDFLGYLEKGAVGEVCAHFYDLAGKPIRTALDERLITVELEDYLRIPLRIGIAGRIDKLLALRGALKGGYINVLVTDYDTAAELLRDPGKN